MKLKIFYDRPVLSIVISVVIVLLGLLALKGLPVEQYPDMAPPTINVWATYPGASAETVLKAVIVPLEEAINGVEDMTYMTSTASNTGDASINIYFKQGINADMASVNVQNRVSTALSLLPAEVTQMGVSTNKQQNAELKTIALYSPTDRYDAKFIDNYAKINIEPQLKRIGGIGNVSNYCAQYSMRIWLDPGKMAQYKLNPTDIEAVLANQNIEAATGAFGENSPSQFQYSMKYRGRKGTPEEFETLVVKALPNGDVLRLKDVARIELGSELYNFYNKINGHEASIITCYQSAGSNASATIKEIDKVLDQVREDMPEGLEIVSLSDTNRFLYASIWEVVSSLILAIILVVLVVYVFLQDLRSTLIPTLAIIVSIIGTFACIAILDFSINLLTLFALVLAIGTVVDNAIVVVEAVQAKFDAGYRSSYMATHDAMGNITAAIVVSTLIFMAVFIPVSMIGGTSGYFYKQFGLTMAVAVGISAINAFTLSPALCALLLKPYVDENGQQKDNFAARFRKTYNIAFKTITHRYMDGVLFFIKRKWFVWCVLGLGIGALLPAIKYTKTGFIPQEDTGTLMVSFSTQPGTGLDATQGAVDRLNSYIQQMPEVEYVGGVTGFSFSGIGPSQGIDFISLRPWDERKGRGHSAEEVKNRIYTLASEVRDANIFVDLPPMIPGYGMGGGLELYLQDKKDGDIEEFKALTDKFVEALSQRKEIGEVYSAFETSYPQYWVDIDAAKCEQAGISPGEILQNLSIYYGGSYASNFNRFSKLYRVMLQSEPSSRISPESLESFYIRAGEEMAPMSQFVTLTKTYGPSDLSRFNLYNSIMINASAAPGYSTGDAIKAIHDVAKETLPPGYGYEYGGMTREEASTGGNVALIFGLCMVLVYLILCALYESLFLPFAIILAVPCGIAGSFLATQALGLENNIYLQIGVIMLIGLLAKTAILLTDYAQKNRKKGMSLTMSAYTAAKVRLRPILMTALTMVFGMIPLLIATGVGANGSRSIATGAVGGMLLGTLVLLFLVPVLFIVFQWLHERVTFLIPKKPASLNATIIGVMALSMTLTMNSCGLYRSYSPQNPETIQKDLLSSENLIRGDLRAVEDLGNVKNAEVKDDNETANRVATASATITTATSQSTSELKSPDNQIDTTDPNSIASIPWQEFFVDLVLQSLIKEGLENNKDLSIARLRTEEAQASLNAAKLGYLPSLGVTADGSLNKMGNAPTAKTYNIGAAVSWEIDIFGRVKNSKGIALENLLASEAYRQAVQSQLIATIAQSYFNLLSLDEGLEIYHQTLVSWQETVRTLEVLKTAGRTNDAAVLQARSNMLSVEQLLRQTQQNVLSTENALSVLLGRVPGKIERSDMQRQLITKDKLSVGLPMDILRRRPDVRQAEHTLAAAYYATNVAKSRMYPSLTLSGALGFTNNGGGVELNPGQWLSNAATNLFQPIFEKGQIKADIKIAQAQQTQALLQWEQTVLNAGAEVNDILSTLYTARENLVSAQEQITLLEEAVRKTKLLMTHSTGNYLEVLTAEQSLLDARTSRLQYTLENLNTSVMLYQALGGGSN